MGELLEEGVFRGSVLCVVVVGGEQFIGELEICGEPTRDAGGDSIEVICICSGRMVEKLEVEVIFGINPGCSWVLTAPSVLSLLSIDVELK